MTQTYRRAERPLWARLVISLFAVLAIAGCGSSSNDFVVTGNNNNPNPGPGSLTFQFVKAQAATVPQTTTDILFTYLDGDGDTIEDELRDFANTITVFPPSGMATVRITAIDANGFPLMQLVGAQATPPAGTNVNVDLTTYTLTDITFDSLTVTPDPTVVTAGVNVGNTQQLTVTAGFSNGQNIVFNTTLLGLTDFNDNGSTNYTVSGTGLVTAVVAGDSTLTASFTDSEGQTRADTIDVSVTGGVIPDVLVVTPDTLGIPIGGTSTAVSATLNGNAIANNLLTFSIVDNTTGFTANADGTVSVDGSVLDGTPATLQVALTSDPTVTDTVALTANTAVVVSRQFSIPDGDTSLPYGITFQLQVSETFDNGQTVVVADPVAAGYSFSVTNATQASVTADGLLSTGNVTDLADVNLIFDAATVDTFELDVDPTVTVTSLTITPDFFQLTPGQSANFTATADFDGGLQDLDVTQSADLTFPAFTSGDSTFENGVVTGGTGITYDPGRTYTADLGGATDDVEVEVALGFITSLDVTVGESDTLNIPAFLDGVIDVYANTADGQRLHLNPSFQYNVSLVDTNNTFDLGGTNSNTLEPGAGAALGGTDDVDISLTDSDYWYADGDATIGEVTITPTYTSAGGTSSASAGFKHYPDLNVIFTSRTGTVTTGTLTPANFVPRAVDLLFTNASVTDFRVAFDNAVESAGHITLVEDIYGYPAIHSTIGGNVIGDYPSANFEIEDDLGNLIKVATFPAVEVMNRTQTGGGGTSMGESYVLPVQAIGVGASETFTYTVNARDTLLSNTVTTFDLTEEFNHNASDGAFLRPVVDAGLLVVYALSTNGNASVSETVTAERIDGFNMPGAPLDITINQ